jgi:hypothetical protein
MAIAKFPSFSLGRFPLFLVLLSALGVSHAIAGMGRLEAFLDHGFSDGWLAEYVSGVYWLENKQVRGAIRYYYSDHDGSEDGRRVISANVKMTTDDPQARVGLVYGYESQTGNYYLMLLGPEGQMEVVRRDADGFNLRMSSSTDADMNGFNLLRIQEVGNEISLSVNGRSLGSLGNNTIGRGAVGIAAVGLGRFGFSEYEEAAAAKRSSAPSARARANSAEPPRSPAANGSGLGKEITWFPLRNNQTGELLGEVPLPRDWKVTPQEWSAPGGVRARAAAGEFLSGVNTSVDQIIQSKLIPLLQQSGNRVLGIEDYPAIAQFDSNYSAQLWKFAPSRDHHAAKGIVYEDDDLKGVIVVHFKNSQSQFGTSSFYSMHVLEGPTAAFEGRKPEFLNALANQRSNPEQIAAYNQREQQMAAGRTRSFNAQQQQKQQQFDSWMATQRQSSSSALDSSMESWRRRQDMTDRGHQRQVDSIAGTTPAYDPSTGQTWQVEDGYDRYFMNSFGEYMSTDDQFYNPNMDPAVNNQDWTEIAPNYYER